MQDYQAETVNVQLQFYSMHFLRIIPGNLVRNKHD